MRIAIDIRKINEFGVGTYIWNLLRNLAVVDDRNEYLLIGSHRHFHELGPLPGNFRQLYLPDEETFWKRQFAMLLGVRRQRVDLLHVPHHDAPFFNPSKLVVTVHDCVHVKFPQENSSKFQNYRSYLRTKRVVEGAKHVLAVSNSTKEDLINISACLKERSRSFTMPWMSGSRSITLRKRESRCWSGISLRNHLCFTLERSAPTRTFIG